MLLQRSEKYRIDMKRENHRESNVNTLQKSMLSLDTKEDGTILQDFKNNDAKSNGKLFVTTNKFLQLPSVRKERYKLHLRNILSFVAKILNPAIYLVFTLYYFYSYVFLS